MITYELAKQLKDAGFSKTKKFPYYFYHINNEKIIYINNGSNLISENQFLYVPTLSELIEACGDKFDSLNNIDTDYDKKFGWQAIQSINLLEKKAALGNTPEEAVAKLWLVLQDK